MQLVYQSNYFSHASATIYKHFRNLWFWSTDSTIFGLSEKLKVILLHGKHKPLLLTVFGKP